MKRKDMTNLCNEQKAKIVCTVNSECWTEKKNKLHHRYGRKEREGEGGRD